MTLDRKNPSQVLSWSAPWRGALVIIAVVAAAYANSFKIPFLFDDEPTIVYNPAMRHLWPISDIFTKQTAHAISRPLMNLTLVLNYQFCGVNARYYHPLNLLVHVMAALALYGVMRRTLPRLKKADFTTIEINLLSLSAALLWAAHPVQVVCVSYIVQRAEAMMGLFYLSALYCVIRSADAERPDNWRLAAWILCFMGMGSKEVMVTAPVVIFMYDSVFLAGSWRGAWRQRKLLYAGLAACWIPLLLFIWAGGERGGTVGYNFGIGWIEYLLTQFKAIVLYLRLSFWPHPLVFDYGCEVVKGFKDVWPDGLVLFLLLSATLYFWFRRPAVGFCMASFFVILSPSSSIVPLITQTMGEHRMYLPLAPVLALAVVGAYRLWVLCFKLKAGHNIIMRWLPLTAVVAVVSIFTILTIKRNYTCQDPVLLWTDNIKNRPNNIRAYVSRGEIYFKNRQRELAMGDFDKALAIDPEINREYYNRGNIYLKKELYAKALEEYDKAVALRPGYVMAINNRGVVYTRLGLYDKALADFNKAIAKRPDLILSFENRGNLHLQFGKLQEALSDYGREIEIDPTYVKAYLSRGIVYMRLSRWREAEQDFGKAIQLKPDFAEAYQNLGDLFVEKDQYETAWQNYNAAIAIDPALATAYIQRSRLSLKFGEYGPALGDMRKVCDLEPQNVNYLVSYARLLVIAPDSELRNGKLALEMANRAAEMSSRNYKALDVLAAAYAKAGSFQDAVRTAREALEKAQAAGDGAASASLKARLEQYMSGK